jgi:hypothetical protein
MTRYLIFPNLNRYGRQKIEAYIFLTQKPVFQSIFNPKQLRNRDKPIHNLKRTKKPSQKLKSTRNQISN